MRLNADARASGVGVHLDVLQEHRPLAVVVEASPVLAYGLARLYLFPAVGHAWQ